MVLWFLALKNTHVRLRFVVFPSVRYLLSDLCWLNSEFCMELLFSEGTQWVAGSPSAPSSWTWSQGRCGKGKSGVQRILPELWNWGSAQDWTCSNSAEQHSAGTLPGSASHCCFLHKFQLNVPLLQCRYSSCLTEDLGFETCFDGKLVQVWTTCAFKKRVGRASPSEC